VLGKGQLQLAIRTCQGEDQQAKGLPSSCLLLWGCLKLKETGEKGRESEGMIRPKGRLKAGKLGFPSTMTKNKEFPIKFVSSVDPSLSIHTTEHLDYLVSMGASSSQILGIVGILGSQQVPSTMLGYAVGKTKG
jgi:hypothetical protein